MFQKSFGKSSLLRIQVFEQNRAFNEDHEVIENLPHVSQAQTSVNDDNIEEVKETVPVNRRVVNRDIAEDLNISYG